MVDLHSLPEGSRPDESKVFRNNGPDNLVLERYKLRELAEGWPCYRDASEWLNFASIFHPDAHVYTTWSGRVPYTTFIAGSKAGMDAGAFIMHRCHGVTSDISLSGLRAVTKMKATITQRFILPPKFSSDGKTQIEVDVECDCRFCFFFEKIEGRWGARLVRHWYEKDKLIPVNPNRVPVIDELKLATYPEGYKFLAYCQESTMGVKVLADLPGHKRHVGTVNGESHDKLYWLAKKWVEGEDVEL